MAEYWVNNAATAGADNGSSEADGFLTITQAMAAVNNGDNVWVKGGTSYAETVAVTDTGSGSSGMRFVGYTTTEGDGGSAVLEGGDSIASGITIASTATVCYLFKNFDIQNYTSHGVSAAGADDLTFDNCRFIGNGGHGLYGDNYITAINCVFDNNTSYGMYCDSPWVSFCTFSDNASGLYSAYSAMMCFSSVFYGQTTYNINVGYGGMIINNTIDGEGGGVIRGINCGGGDESPIHIINNIIYDCSYGIYMGVANAMAGHRGTGRNNLLYSNTINYRYWYDNATATDITASAPGFTDEAGHDYTLAAGSAARNAGADASGTSSPGMDIGAHQSADAGGGGSRVIITG